MKDLFQYLKEQIQYLPLIYRVSKYTNKMADLGTIFGIVWDYVDPLVRAMIYYFVFVTIFHRKAFGVPTGPWMTIGLGVWFFYSGAINAGARSVQYQIGLFSQVKFPISILPTIELFKHIKIITGMGLVGIIMGMYYGYYPSIYYLQLPYYLLALFFAVLSFSLLFSTIVVIFRDFSHILDYILRFALYISGAAIDLSIIEAFPLRVRQAMLLDPFIYVMEGLRDVVFSRAWFWQKPGPTLVFWCFTIGLLIVGAHLHMKLRNSFMDYI